jgi:hypothetical protein
MIVDDGENFELVFTVPDSTDPSKSKIFGKKFKCEEFYAPDFVFFGTLPLSYSTMQAWANYKDQQHEKGRRTQQPHGEIPCLALRTTWRKKVKSFVVSPSLFDSCSFAVRKHKHSRREHIYRERE